MVASTKTEASAARALTATVSAQANSASARIENSANGSRKPHSVKSGSASGPADTEEKRQENVWSFDHTNNIRKKAPAHVSTAPQNSLSTEAPFTFPTYSATPTPPNPSPSSSASSAPMSAACRPSAIIHMVKAGLLKNHAFSQ